MTGRGRASRRRGERGAVAVEFALVVPLLLLLLFGIISYGYMLSFRQAISQGAAEGARAAAVAPAGFTDDEVKTAARGRVTESLQSYGVSCEANGTLKRDNVTAGVCSVTLASCPQDLTRTCVLVNVDYDYKGHSLLPDFPGVGILLPNHLDYEAVAEVS